MPISRDHLETRLEELKAQAEQARHQFIAITGAIADLEYWLAEDAKTSEQEKKE